MSPYFVYSGRVDDQGFIRATQSTISFINSSADDLLSQYSITGDGNTQSYEYPDPSATESNLAAGYAPTTPTSTGIEQQDDTELLSEDMTMLDSAEEMARVTTERDESGPEASLSLDILPSIESRDLSKSPADSAIAPFEGGPSRAQAENWASNSASPLPYTSTIDPTIGYTVPVIQMAPPSTTPGDIGIAPYHLSNNTTTRSLHGAPLSPPLLPPADPFNRHPVLSLTLPLGPRVGQPLPPGLDPLVRAINSLMAQRNGHQPLRAHLKKAYGILPDADAHVIREHFHSGSGVIREESELMYWYGDPAVLPLRVWQFLAVQRPRRRRRLTSGPQNDMAQEDGGPED